MSDHTRARSRQSGFSIVEMLVVLLILAIVSAGILSQLNSALQGNVTEQAKLDYFQQARDFADQFFRDMNQAGYPNPRMVDNSTSWLFNPPTSDSRMAVGIVAIGANEIRFEGSTEGDGTVESVRYQLNGSGTCSFCLQRSEVVKANGVAPTAQGSDWGIEVDGVDTTNPIFAYFLADGSQIPNASLPMDMTTNAATIASIKSIQFSLTVRNSKVLDAKSGKPIEATFQGLVTLSNCSMAASGAPMSCN